MRFAGLKSIDLLHSIVTRDGVLSGCGIVVSAVRRVVLSAVAMILVVAPGSLIADEPADKAAKSAASSSEAAASTEQVSLGEFIDQQIRQGWADNEIEASPLASDEEWVRRVYLDLAGRIPTLTEARDFMNDKNPRKRAMLVDALLEHEDYVRNFTTIWTNNSIGRGRGVGRGR